MRCRKPKYAWAKLVVVTGAGSGIGKATALRFAAGGCRVIVGDLDDSAAAQTVEAIDRTGGDAVSIWLDVADSNAWDRFAGQVRSDHGVPDVVVNAAGTFIAGRFLDHTAEDWERIVAVNLLGVANGCRLFGAQMVEGGRRGHIVNVASIGAYLPLRFAPAYGVTKAGVCMISESLRIELKRHGIGVTAVCPSGVRSNLARNGRLVGLDPESDPWLGEATGAFQNRVALAGPDKVARVIERAVDHDWAIVPVNPDAWAMYAMSRISPRLLRAGAKLASFEAWVGGARWLATRRSPDRGRAKRR